MTTAKHLLETIKASVFKNEEVGGDIVYHLNRLMDKNRNRLPALWLGDIFWKCTEGRVPMHDYNPLTDEKQLQTLTDKEKEEVAYIEKLAGLCHDVGNHFACDLSLILPGFTSSDDWRKDFSVENKALTDFIDNTPYRDLAAYLAKVMIAVKSNEVCDYSPVYQDYLARNDYKYDEFKSAQLTADEYVDISIVALQRIAKHDKTAAAMGLNREELSVNDMLHAWFYDQIDEAQAEAAKEFVDYINRQIDITPYDRPFCTDAYQKLKAICKKHNVEFENDSLAVRYLDQYIGNQYDRTYSGKD